MSTAAARREQRGQREHGDYGERTVSAKNRRGGLGRGLGALIPTAPPEPAPGESSPADLAASADEARATDHASTEQPGASARTDAPAHEAAGEDRLVPVAGAHFVDLPVPQIRPNPKQPRQVFDEDALAELTHSIREFGVLQPIVVRTVGEGADAGYELVMGERRLRAAAQAGLATVPAIVRTTSDDAMLRDALLENIHRAQLNPLEEAAAYQQLLEEFGATHDELALRIGRSRPQVSNTIRLLNLPVPVQRRVAAGVISAGHARALLGVEDPDAQEEFAGRIVAEGLSVRATEELVALHAAGHTEKRTKRRAAPRISAPALVELAERLSDAFDTRVKVDLGRSKGKITIEFATIDDLERIVGMMSGQPAVSGLSGQPAVPGQPTGDVGAWDERIRYDPNES